MWRPKEDWEKERDYWLNTVGGKFADSGEAMEASVIYEAGANAILKALKEKSEEQLVVALGVPLTQHTVVSVGGIKGFAVFIPEEN